MAAICGAHLALGPSTPRFSEPPDPPRKYCPHITNEETEAQHGTGPALKQPLCSVDTHGPRTGQELGLRDFWVTAIIQLKWTD